MTAALTWTAGDAVNPRKTRIASIVLSSLVAACSGRVSYEQPAQSNTGTDGNEVCDKYGTQACESGIWGDCIDSICNSAQPATELKLGSGVSCALLGAADVNGAYALSCWGTNADNQLRTSGSNRPVPGNVHVGPVRDVGVGGQFMCVLDDGNDSITCWGANHFNQLAVKDTSSTENTFTVNGAVAITSGADSSCAIT